LYFYNLVLKVNDRNVKQAVFVGISGKGKVKEYGEGVCE
jgi:hypothetical protein